MRKSFLKVFILPICKHYFHRTPQHEGKKTLFDMYRATDQLNHRSLFQALGRFRLASQNLKKAEKERSRSNEVFFSLCAITVNLICRRLHEMHGDVDNFYICLWFSFSHSKLKRSSWSYSCNSNRLCSKTRKWKSSSLFRTTVGPRNNSLAFKGYPSITVNILRSQITVSNVISPLFKGNPEIKVKNLRSQWDWWGGVLLYIITTKKKNSHWISWKIASKASNTVGPRLIGPIGTEDFSPLSQGYL